MGKTISIIAAVVLVAAAAALLILTDACAYVNDGNWVYLKELQDNDIAEFFKAPIVSVKLSENVDSNDCVAFEDEELVEEWKMYFDNVKVMPYDKPISDPQSAPADMGWRIITAVNADGKELSMKGLYADEGCKLNIKGVVYITQDSFGFPFESTFWRAIERHGTATISYYPV